MSCPESLKGSGRNNIASTTEKTAVIPPIPIASVRIAVTANPGDLRSCRQPITHIVEDCFKKRKPLLRSVRFFGLRNTAETP